MSYPHTTAQEQLFLLRITQLELMPVLKYVMETNPSAELPYHNNQHAFMVAMWGYDLLSFYDTEDLRTMVTAGLFHDYDHTGGTEPDTVNIERAIDGFETFLSKDLLDTIELPIVAQDRIKDAIASTLYPSNKDPQNALQACLRDADMLAGSITDPKVVMDGLRSELSVTKGTDISLEEMIEIQKSFIPNVNMYSIPGKLVWSNVYESILETQRQYVSTVLSEEEHY